MVIHSEISLKPQAGRSWNNVIIDSVISNKDKVGTMADEIKHAVHKQFGPVI